MKQYVTFGQDHTHSVNGKTFDCDCVATYEAENANVGRDKAFEIFGSKFAFHYSEPNWNIEHERFYPRGYIEVE